MGQGRKATGLTKWQSRIASSSRGTYPRRLTGNVQESEQLRAPQPPDVVITPHSRINEQRRPRSDFATCTQPSRDLKYHHNILGLDAVSRGVAMRRHHVAAAGICAFALAPVAANAEFVLKNIENNSQQIVSVSYPVAARSSANFNQDAVKEAVVAIPGSGIIIFQDLGPSASYAACVAISFRDQNWVYVFYEESHLITTPWISVAIDSHGAPSFFTSPNGVPGTLSLCGK